jgi:hypothetical protein
METTTNPHDVSPWLKLSFLSNTHKAVIELREPIMVNGEKLNQIACSITAPKTEMKSFKKADGGIVILSQVKSWPFILYRELNAYNNSKDDAYKQSFVKSVDHENVLSITLYDLNGNIVLKQESN